RLAFAATGKPMREMKEAPPERGLSIGEWVPLFFLERRRYFGDDGASAATHLADAAHRVALPERIGCGVAKLLDFATELAAALAGRALRAFDHPVMTADCLFTLLLFTLDNRGLHLSTSSILPTTRHSYIRRQLNAGSSIALNAISGAGAW